MENSNNIVCWDFKLDFDLPLTRVESAPPPPKIPPRQVLQDRFPRILNRIEILWGSRELHQYLEQTLFSDRPARQGFPLDVMQALAEIHHEHTLYLKSRKILTDSAWDHN
jgi:hypothetical protein